MSYGIVMSEEAGIDLSRFPLPIQNLVENELRKLASDPVALSRPSSFPYIPAQSYRITARLDESRYFLTVLFRYSQDEKNIEVFAIGAMIT